MTSKTLMGPLGMSTNCPEIDPGTMCLARSDPPAIELEPITIWIPPKSFEIHDEFSRKMKLGAAIYKELGLAGQIAEKFMSLPYRKGKIIKGKKDKSAQLEGGGLVCTSFAKIFGAIWFAGDPKKQEKLKKKAGERVGPSPARVYAKKYKGSLVSNQRLTFDDLYYLDASRLYAVVTYASKTGEFMMIRGKEKKSRKHIWFLIYAKSLKDWVRIESTGWDLATDPKGPGPGIYRLKRPKKKNIYYEVWDWGSTYRDRDPDLDSWDYST